MPVILLAGGSGLIGSRLAEMLREKGHIVRILSRSAGGADRFVWNPAAGTMDETALQGIDYVINLAGANIAERRWTAGRKKEIIRSRVQSAQTLRDAFQRTGIRPKAYLSASAIGYYGNSGERLMTEADAPVDNGFMAECCRAWEAAAAEVAALGIRTVTLRIGIVLARGGGVLAEFVKPLRFGAGVYFADGRGWYSWVHLDDVCRFFMFSFDNQQIDGVFNVVTPQPVRNRDLVRAIAQARQRPAVFVSAPAFALRLALGEMAAAVLSSNRVSAEKALQAGFGFRYPELTGALEAIF